LLQRPNTSHCLLIALAVAGLMSAAMPSAAHAGGGSVMHRAGSGYGQDLRAGRAGVLNLHRAFSFRGLRQAKRSGRHVGGPRRHLHKGRKHQRFGRQHRRGHHYVYASKHYDRRPRYNRDRYESRREVNRATGSYDTKPQTAADRLPTFKWIHVGALDGDALSLGEVAPSENAARLTNCLSVRTQITVDGAPLEAFGKACVQGDGTWRLIPDEPAEY
jgi:hypothetical protein